MVIFPPSSTDLQLLSPDSRAEGFSARAAIIGKNKGCHNRKEQGSNRLKVLQDSGFADFIIYFKRLSDCEITETFFLSDCSGRIHSF